MPHWGVYHGDGRPHELELPPPPPWRQFDGEPSPIPPRRAPHDATRHRATTYRPVPEAVEMVNLALFLRRPLLVTGPPGTGKSSLAHHVAHELGLGRVLTWPITSRSTLADGLYAYDAIGRLHDANLAQAGPAAALPSVGDYIRLGPLGTALAPWQRPRVLLIDEFDKSDIDLPNDLLHVLESGGFEIPQLSRRAEREDVVNVMTDDREYASIRDGVVRCAEFPFVVITSNGERPFPPAFLRRCIRLELGEPSLEQLSAIVAAHLGDEHLAARQPLIEAFLAQRQTSSLATDQLLNAVFMAAQAPRSGAEYDELLSRLLRPLDDARGRFE